MVTSLVAGFVPGPGTTLPYYPASYTTLGTTLPYYPALVHTSWVHRLGTTLPYCTPPCTPCYPAPADPSRTCTCRHKSWTVSCPRAPPSSQGLVAGSDYPAQTTLSYPALHYPALPCPDYPALPKEEVPTPRDAPAITPSLDAARRATATVTSSCSWTPGRF